MPLFNFCNAQYETRTPSWESSTIIVQSRSTNTIQKDSGKQRVCRFSINEMHNSIVHRLSLFAIDKKSALAMAIRQIESSFGKGSVMQLGSA